MATTQCDVLITAVPLPPRNDENGVPTNPHHRPQILSEANQVAAAYAERAHLLVDPTLADFSAALDGRSIWVASMHGDVPLEGELVPAFCSDGRPESVSLRALVETARPHVVDGRLRLIVLMGCKSLGLAKKLRELTGVPAIVCWETLVQDGGACVWGLLEY